MPLSAKTAVSCRGSQPIITADLTCLECELGVPLLACMYSHKQQGERRFGNLHTRDIKAGAFNVFHEQCHTEVYNIIRMQMTPKIITIRYIKRYKTLATLKFSTAAYRVVVSTDHIRLNAWPSNYLFTP